MKLGDVGPITVESPTLNLGHSLHQHVERSIQRAISRSFNTLNSANVIFRQEGDLFACTVMLKVEGTSEEFVAEAKGTDCYKTFSMAMIKMDGQLRKTKESLRHRKGRKRVDKEEMLSPKLTERWEGDYA